MIELVRNRIISLAIYQKLTVLMKGAEDERSIEPLPFAKIGLRD